jgi:predicted ribosomally synthesized peptide with nif11-like leader
MGSGSFKTFLAMVQHDAGLRQELRAAGGNANLSAEALIAFAAAKGYAFELEDVSGELDDKQLEAVAGGSFPASDMSAMQQLMDKKNQLESAISNIIKASGNAQGTIASNLKP